MYGYRGLIPTKAVRPARGQCDVTIREKRELFLNKPGKQEEVGNG